MIARVFPLRTAASPTDNMAFFGPPTIENIADCINAGVNEVHISVACTWDLERAEERTGNVALSADGSNVNGAGRSSRGKNLTSIGGEYESSCSL